MDNLVVSGLIISAHFSVSFTMPLESWPMVIITHLYFQEGKLDPFYLPSQANIYLYQIMYLQVYLLQWCTVHYK